MSSSVMEIQRCTPTMLTVLVILLADYLLLSHTAPLSAPTSHDRPRRQSLSRLTSEQRKILDMAPYLAKMGYLSNGRPESTPTAVDEVRAALKKYQQIANISETGSLDWTTERKMSSQRCGMTDANIARSPTDPQNYELLPSKWTKNVITWSLDNATPDLDSGRVRSALSQAFNLWKEVSALSFNEVNPAGQSDIRVSFARLDHKDGFPFDGPGKTLAHAFAPGEMQGGDVHFDEDETWTEFKSTGTNLYTVAAHELGHSLGISHSNVVGALMYPYYAGYNPNMKLHDDDIAAIQKVYGAPSRPNIATTRPSGSTPPSRPAARPTVTQAPQTSTPSTDSLPNPCTTKIDAISYMRGEIFVFKGKWFWRLNQYRVIVGNPVRITDFWTVLPKTLKKVDAVVQRPSDSALIFFIGDRYYELRSNTELVPGFPSTGGRSLSILLGKQSSSTLAVDAAFIWLTGSDKIMYITVGHSYYRLSGAARTPLSVEGSARNIRDKWSRIPVPLDAAFTHPYGYSYFFRDGQVWRYDTRSASAGTYVSLSQLWPQCPETPTFAQQGMNSAIQRCHLPDLLWITLLFLLFCNNLRFRLL